MITKYQIRMMSNGEEALILWITMDEEFSLDWFQKLKDKNLQDFIRQHQIIWNGTKVFLVVGGITLAVLNYEPSSGENIAYLSDSILPSTSIVEKTDWKLPEASVMEQELKEEEKVTDDVGNLSTGSEISTPSTIPPKNFSTSSGSSSQSNNSSNPVEEIPPITDSSESSKEEVDEVLPDLTTYVTVYRSNGQVVKLALEDYLIGVVAAEMPASFHTEALKVQSILARTYAMKALDSGKKLTDTVSTQRYVDTNEMKNMWGGSYTSYYQKIKNAVVSTQDLVVTYQGNLIDCVYHSTSNGMTEDSENVWGNAFSYLQSVSSPWDKEASSYFRSVSFSKQEFMNIFGLSDANYQVEILSRNRSGRVSFIRVGDKTYSGVEFRTMLSLRSTDFYIYLGDMNVRIDTRGYGHGVGLSQYGANGMAKEGSSFSQIISYYYTGVEVISYF